MLGQAKNGYQLCMAECHGEKRATDHPQVQDCTMQLGELFEKVNVTFESSTTEKVISKNDRYTQSEH